MPIAGLSVLILAAVGMNAVALLFIDTPRGSFVGNMVASVAISVVMTVVIPSFTNWMLAMHPDLPGHASSREAHTHTVVSIAVGLFISLPLLVSLSVMEQTGVVDGQVVILCAWGCVIASWIAFVRIHCEDDCR